MAEYDHFKILNYLFEHQEYYINILELFNQHYAFLPKETDYIPFYKNLIIDSLIAFTSGGNYYLYLKEEFLQDAIILFNKNIDQIFSIYGPTKTLQTIFKNSELKVRTQIDYLVMKVTPETYHPLLAEIKAYQCQRCNIDHFDKLKKMQYLYHKEEVYTQNAYYPYQAEMQAYKSLLKEKINFAVFTDDKRQLAVSKVNINAESPDLYQIGGVYTLKEYRKRNLSMFCLTVLINYIFSQTSKKGVILYVKKSNIPAINLYYKLGFQVIYEASIYYI